LKTKILHSSEKEQIEIALDLHRYFISNRTMSFVLPREAKAALFSLL